MNTCSLKVVFPDREDRTKTKITSLNPIPASLSDLHAQISRKLNLTSSERIIFKYEETAGNKTLVSTETAYTELLKTGRAIKLVVEITIAGKDDQFALNNKKSEYKVSLVDSEILDESQLPKCEPDDSSNLSPNNIQHDLSEGALKYIKWVAQEVLKKSESDFNRKLEIQKTEMRRELMEQLKEAVINMQKATKAEIAALHKENFTKFQNLKKVLEERIAMVEKDLISRIEEQAEEFKSTLETSIKNSETQYVKNPATSRSGIESSAKSMVENLKDEFDRKISKIKDDTKFEMEVLRDELKEDSRIKLENQEMELRDSIESKIRDLKRDVEKMTNLSKSAASQQTFDPSDLEVLEKQNRGPQKQIDELKAEKNVQFSKVKEDSPEVKQQSQTAIPLGMGPIGQLDPKNQESEKSEPETIAQHRQEWNDDSEVGRNNPIKHTQEATKKSHYEEELPEYPQQRKPDYSPKQSISEKKFEQKDEDETYSKPIGTQEEDDDLKNPINQKPEEVEIAIQKKPYQAEVVLELTDPDDQEPGAEFQIEFCMKNIGDKPWAEDTALYCIHGSFKANPVKLGSVEPQEEQPEFLKVKAPVSAGQYKSLWRLGYMDGKKISYFGPTLSFEVNVEGEDAFETESSWGG